MNHKLTRKLFAGMHVKSTEQQVGPGGVRTRRKDIHATGAQSCVTTVPERSYVMDR